MALWAHREEVHELLESQLADFRFYRQTRKYGENTDKSDLDILVDGPAGTPFTILPRSRWNWLTKGFMASDVLNRAKIDAILMP